MFECPRCDTQVPKWKSAIMTNFTKIECENCGAKLKPDTSAMTKIGMIGAVIIFLLYRIMIQTLGIFGAVLAFVVGFLAACVATVRMTKFEVIED